MDFEIIEQTTAYQGYFQIVRYRLRHTLFGGGWGPVITREIFERGDAAAVLPYDPICDTVVLIEQFRSGALRAPGGPWLFEIVAGVIETNESPEAVVRREAVEEAGRTLQRVVPICDYLVSPGGTSERIHLFCGEVDSRGAEGVFGVADEHEDIRVQVVSFSEACAWLGSGRLNSASSIIAMQWLQLNRDKIRRLWEKAD